MQTCWTLGRNAVVFGVVLGLGVLLAGPGLCLAKNKDAVDPAIKHYEKVSGVDGSLNSIGSDTLNNLMTYWAEAFSKLYPNVKIQVEGKGSATAPPALIAGTAQLGPMSRTMKPEEIDAFEKKHGFKPTRISVALDSRTQRGGSWSNRSERADCERTKGACRRGGGFQDQGL